MSELRPSFEEIAQIVGAKNVLSPDDAALRSVRWGSDDPCRCRMLAMPRNTEQVARIVRLCAEHNQAMTVHGGRTGMAGGAVSRPSDVVISLEKLSGIELLGPGERRAIAGAGVTLQTVQEFAQANGSMFAVDFGARGSATVGGTIATNAGGNRVFRYGMIRDQVLGLEVVLADGTVIDGLKGIIKDNSGYDLKQLFVGSEGTLGIVTRAVLRLRPQTLSRNTALLAFDDFGQVLAFLNAAEERLGPSLSAFEIMWRSFFEAVSNNAGGVAGIDNTAPLYALIEAEGGDPDRDDSGFLAVLETTMEAGLFRDALIAQSVAQRDALWAIREDVERLMRLGDRIDFDVSLPISRMARYVEDCETAISKAIAGVHVFIFGHVADNNLHIMAVRPAGFSNDEKELIKTIVYQPLGTMGGSISAEHGIGLDKKSSLAITRNSAELELMRRIKRALDPCNLLNPGKVVDVAA